MRTHPKRRETPSAHDQPSEDSSCGETLRGRSKQSGGGLEDAATHPPPSPSTIPLTPYRKAVKEHDEFAVAGARLAALVQQLRETAKQRADL